MLRKILSRPIVQFLLLGLIVFLVFKAFFQPRSADTDSIVVSEEALLAFIQNRSQRIDPEGFRKLLTDMPQEEYQELVNAYIRQEVLYREALKMGLDQNDYVIKNRMIQKMEFLNNEASERAVNLNQELLQQYYEENKEKYFQPAIATFTHVFFNAEKRGDGQAASDAENTLRVLKSRDIPFEQSVAYGDRFYYNTNYVEKDAEYVSSHFGEEVTTAIYKPEEIEGWAGPYKSEYGYHLLLRTRYTEGRYPELEEILTDVRRDASYDRVEELGDRRRLRRGVLPHAPI